MIKKIWLMTIFIIMSVFIQGSNVTNIRANTYPPQIVFDLDSTNPKYTMEYDDYTRLLFLNVGDKKSTYSKAVKNILPSHLELMSDYKYNNSHGFFLKLKKNVFQKVTLRKNPNRLVVDLSSSPRNKQYTIVIDPGHGGKDPGAVNGKTYEKNVVLAVGKYLRDNLKKDFNVVMTRDKDEYITLGNRSKISNGVEADLFISLHVNSAKSTTANGMEVFYFSKKSSPYAQSIAKLENDFGEKYGEDTSLIVQIAGEIVHNKNQEKSIPFAEKLNTDLAKKTGMYDRGIHGANFAVLRGINSPGVLVELGFIKNAGDHKKITSQSYQKKMADTIASHVRNYFY